MPPHDVTSKLTSTEALVIQNTLSHLTAETKRNADAVFAINESLRTLTRLEVTHSATLKEVQTQAVAILDQEKRLQVIERDMPGLRELRRWVVGGILAGIAMIGTAAVTVVLAYLPRLAT
jgi:hypothetical protein